MEREQVEHVYLALAAWVFIPLLGLGATAAVAVLLSIAAMVICWRNCGWTVVQT